MAHNDNADRVRTHTSEHGSNSAGRAAAPMVAVCLAFALAMLPSAVRAATAPADEWHPTHARVVWVRDPMVYVASDSGVLVPGMAISIKHGKRHVAAALVERMLEPGLWAARRQGGSFAREKRLDKLRVLTSPTLAASYRSYRVGLPAPSRTQLLFACSAPRWNDPLGLPYAADTVSRRLVRLRRGAAPSPLEPETLIVRFFADVADQEIALERGELDVAVFWPGELSARMRSDARWREPRRVRRVRGVLACVGADSLAPDPGALATLQRDVFAGDLEPLSVVPEPGAPPARLVRLEPDASLPGAAALARALGSAGRQGPALRLTYLPEADAAALAPAVRGGFALRCVVLSSQALRGLLSPGLAMELANLLQCEAAR